MTPLSWLKSLFTPKDPREELCEALDRFTAIKNTYDHARRSGWPCHHLDMPLVKARTAVLRAEQAVLRLRPRQRAF